MIARTRLALIGKEGVNFSAVAKTPADVADVLMMALTLAPQKAKAKK